jgi:hypothetical protein
MLESSDGLMLRGGDDSIVELAESLDDFRADALRRAGNDDDLL